MPCSGEFDKNQKKGAEKEEVIKKKESFCFLRFCCKTVLFNSSLSLTHTHPIQQSPSSRYEKEDADNQSARQCQGSQGKP